MDLTTAERLVEINRNFYADFSEEFSATRRRLQPGVRRIITGNAGLDPFSRILDLGCGNGELVSALLRLDFQGTYLGLDFSKGLLEAAKKNITPTSQVIFQQSDLTVPNWSSHLSDKTFDIVLALAVLHHIPGEENRLSILREVRRLLAPGGRYIHSVWQFLNSPRWVARILPWDTVGLEADQLDPGDTLLDWRSGGNGLRYVHHFSREELQNLAVQAGFRVIETFSSDGKEGNLGLYQVWNRYADGEDPS